MTRLALLLFLLLLSGNSSYDLTLMGVTKMPLTVLGAADAVFDPGFVSLVIGGSVASLAGLECLSAPQGSLAADDALATLRLGESTLSGAELGLFALSDINSGRELGSYPGGLRERGEWVASGKSATGSAARYAWTLDAGGDAAGALIIDPTAFDGELEECTSSALGFFSVPTLLCHMNEAPDSASLCVRAIEEEIAPTGILAAINGPNRGVRFVATRPIKAGEELFTQYDRARRRKRMW